MKFVYPLLVKSFGIYVHEDIISKDLMEDVTLDGAGWQKDDHMITPTGCNLRLCFWLRYQRNLFFKKKVSQLFSLTVNKVS